MSYNFQIVIIGTTILGISCGALGVFMLYQKQALMSDALSHATLPGITIAYLVLVALRLPERSLGALIVGALATAGLCIVLYRALKRTAAIHNDAIIAILLSSFFGLGIAFLGIIQKQPQGHAAGLTQYIYGDTASMLRRDVLIISVAAAATTAIIAALFKEIVATTFDRQYARSIGIRTNAIEGLLLFLMVFITIVGLQAVGLILMISLFIIPALSARYWTARIVRHLSIAALFAVISTVSGTIASTNWIQLPTGAAIVLSAGALFVVSILGGARNGLIGLFLARRKIQRQFNLLQLLIALRFHLNLKRLSAAADRAKYLDLHGAVTHHWIADHLQINHRPLKRAIRLARARRLLIATDHNSYRITAAGAQAMKSALYRHQLIEAAMRLFPSKTVYLQESSDARAEQLFTAEEMERLAAHMDAHYPYLTEERTKGARNIGTEGAMA